MTTKKKKYALFPWRGAGSGGYIAPVRLVDDPHERYKQCALLHPSCRVHLKRIEPSLSDCILPVTVSALRSLDDVARHLRKTHWDGCAATYRWEIRDSTGLPWARGDLHLAADQGHRFVVDLLAMLKNMNDGSGWDEETLAMVSDYAEESARQLGLRRGPTP